MTTHPDPKPMNTELHTNDEPQRILLEASERIKACYPPGTRIAMELPSGTVLVGTVLYNGFGNFLLRTDGDVRRFVPAIHPHRVLP